jgi:hypothetical protein
MLTLGVGLVVSTPRNEEGILRVLWGGPAWFFWVLLVAWFFGVVLISFGISTGCCCWVFFVNAFGGCLVVVLRGLKIL